MTFSSLAAFLREHSQEMTQALEELVVHESPSRDKQRLDTLARLLQQRYAMLGAEATVSEDGLYGDHLNFLFTALGSVSRKPPALVVGHFDTVWPAGTVAARPFRTHEGKAWGPGVFDMKAGIVITEFALRAIRESGERLPRAVVVFLASDEELGSPSSRRPLALHCKKSEYALVLEPPLPDGTLKTARKGSGRFTLKVAGRASHAGIEPEKGVSAVKELAHQILRLEELNDTAKGTTVNVGLIRGGSGPNVVPAHAEAEVNFRAWTAAEMDRLREIVQNLTAVAPAARLAVEEGPYRPPMERTAQSKALFDRARRIAGDLNMKLREGSSGGGSDGNLCSALGVPTLDGLGALGDGAHAEDEHVVLESLRDRALLLAALLMTL